MEDTKDPKYADRLSTLESKKWKRVLNMQAPYKWNLARLELGKTLDVGCGLGRNLLNLENGVGFDHNRDSVLIARSKGLTAYSTDEWESSPDAEKGFRQIQRIFYGWMTPNFGRQEPALALLKLRITHFRCQDLQANYLHITNLCT